MPVVIASFSPNDKVPGFYGQDTFGTLGQSAAGLPIALLLVGLMAGAGTLVSDTQVQQIFQPSDLDTYAGIGSELAEMGYDALATESDIPIFIASPKPPAGGVAATATITVGGAWTVAGTIGVRIGGQLVTSEVNAADTIAQVCTNLAAAINGAFLGRLPITATAGATSVTLNCATPGARGNQHIVFLQPAGSNAAVTAPAGLTLSFASTWLATTAYTTSAYVVPATAPTGFYYKCTTAGTTGSSQPTFPSTIGSTVTDGTVTWTCWGQVVAGAGTALGSGITLGGGSGLESYTNLLQTLNSQGYGRIALAANDSTSLAAWKTQIDTEAGPLTGYLQQAIVAMNTTVSAAASITQTTLNDPRFQLLFTQNCETHPSREAACNGAWRAFQETSDPDHNYDGDVLPTVAVQSQPADQPIHSVQVAMLNEGITPTFPVNQQTTIVRAITTKNLTNSQPDYSVLDVGFVSSPDFALMDLKATWGPWAKANPRLRGPLAPGEKKPASGVGYPDLWNSKVNTRLLLMEQGAVPGTCPPIVEEVEQNPPITDLDPTAVGRLMTAVIFNTMPGTHQVGVSIQGV